MRNRILTIALLIILPFFVTACSLKELPVVGKFFAGGGKIINQSSSITVWGLWENTDVIDVLIKKYNEENPNISVVYDDRSILKPDEYRETLVTRLAEEGNVPADIVLVHSSWVSKIKDSLSPAPASFMSVSDYENTFYPSASDSAIIDGKIYASPVYYDGLALIYNKQHFAEIDQETPPTAWEEFRRLALSLTRRDENGNIVRAGAAIGASTNIDFFSDILGLMFVQAGVSVPDGVDTEKARDAVSFYTNFVNEDKVWSSSFPEASEAFAQEKVSMIFIPSWNLLDILKTRPDLDIGVAPVPQARPDSPGSWGSFWMYAVPNNSNNKDAAWDFIKFLSTQEAQLLMFSTASQYRNYGAPYSNILLKEQVSDGVASKYIKPYLDVAPFARGSSLAARAGNTNTVNLMRDAITSIVEPDTNKRAKVEEAMKSVKDSLMGITTK